MAGPQSVESGLSIDDYRYVEEHGLGEVVGIYRIRKGFVHAFLWLGLFLLLVSVVHLAIIVVDLPDATKLENLRNQHPATIAEAAQLNREEKKLKRHVTYSDLFHQLVDGVFAIAMGLICLIAIKQFRRESAIVCEYGLLQVRRPFRKDRVEVVRWEDI